MIPASFHNYAQSVFFTPILLSNVLFWLESGYWDLPSQFKPLLHTWSIAIEGQFYILFPLFFLIKEKKKTLIILILIWLISLLMTIFNNSDLLTIQTDKFLSLADHFMPFGRWWELMSGSFVAFFFNYNKEINLKYNKFFSILGISLIAISIFTFERKYSFGSLSIIPVLGTVLLLIYSTKGNLVYRFLNLKFINHIGEISYSLYLWHFPILVFFKYFLDQNLGVDIKFYIILLTYFLSLLSYRYIETPFYKHNFLSNKIFIIILASMIFSISSFGLFIKSNQTLFSKIAKETSDIKKEFTRYNFGENIPTNSVEEKKFSENKNSIKILVIGDSHGRDLANTFDIFDQSKEKYEFSFLESRYYHTYYQEIGKNSNRKLLIDNSDYVFLSKQFTSEKNQISKIKKLAAIVKGLNKKFVIVGSAPEFYTSEGDLLLSFLLESEKNKDNLREKNYEAVNKYFYLKLKTYLLDTNVVLKKLANDLDIYYLDRFEFTCDFKNELCFGLDQSGNKLFKDYTHFTEAGIVFFAKNMQKINWLSKINY